MGTSTTVVPRETQLPVYLLFKLQFVLAARRLSQRLSVTTSVFKVKVRFISSQLLDLYLLYEFLRLVYLCFILRLYFCQWFGSPADTQTVFPSSFSFF